MTASLSWNPRDLGSQTENLLRDLDDPGSCLGKVSWDLADLGSCKAIMSLDHEDTLHPIFAFERNDEKRRRRT